MNATYRPMHGLDRAKLLEHLVYWRAANDPREPWAADSVLARVMVRQVEWELGRVG